MQMEIILLSETKRSQKVQIQKYHTFPLSVTHMLCLDRKTCMYMVHERNYMGGTYKTSEGWNWGKREKRVRYYGRISLMHNIYSHENVLYSLNHIQ